MNTKTLLLFSYIEDGFQTDIRCLVNNNESFKNKGRITHINKSNIQSYNNKKRREREKLNKERKLRLDETLEEERLTQKERNKELEETKKIHKNYDNHILKLKAIQEINMDSELEDMESYI